jgi:2-polyprenyl-3-methyl-5-hydroxy-6-metoxy-1,4-benzoquinol methylase
MRKHTSNPEKWRKNLYRIESQFAQKILASEKDSPDRERLFQEGYSEITKIFDAHKPGGGVTDYTDVVATLVKKIIQNGGRIFDLGCASGNLLYALVNLGYEIEGIDVSEVLIQKAKDRLDSISKAHTVCQSDIMSYVPQTTFDCVVMDNIIEHFHLDSVDDILLKCRSMLKEDGYIIILTPHRFSGPHDTSKYFLPLGAKSKGFHLKEFSFTDLYEKLEQTGFRTILGYPFHPRLLRKIHVIPNCSKWAARKAIILEGIFEKIVLSRLLTIDATLSRALVSLLFPAICVAQK